MNPNDFFDFYEEFSKKFSKELEELGIGILFDFRNNKEIMLEFYRQYIEPNKPKIVLCGINPGKDGAGKTGIPFFDFHSLSKLSPKMCETPIGRPEPSSKFIYPIIEHFGINDFFKHFYLTNISCVGFCKLGKEKNINYHELPLRIQLFLFDRFAEEMRIINPKIIVPLSEKVEKNLKALKHEQKLSAEIGKRLLHPCYPKADKKEYIKVLEQYKNQYAN